MISIAPPPAIIAPVNKNNHQVNFKGDLKLLEHNKVWQNFVEISKIYRESGHMGEISEYIQKRMHKAGFEVRHIPNDGTVIATRGLNAQKDNAIILQSHMDIVGVSADKNSKKPIEFHEKDGYVYANDRTAGFDDGIGVADMLTIADDPKFEKYPLQMIFTTDEETGMDGANLLQSGDFHGKYLINLDSEKSNELVIGCAGIKEFEVKEPIPSEILTSGDYKKLTVSLGGASGGHSADIKPTSLNPIKTLISEFKAIDTIGLVSLKGGEVFNSVPTGARAEILVHKKDEEAVLKRLSEHLATLKEQKIASNPEFSYEISSEDASIGTQYIEPQFQEKLLGALDSVPVGLLSKFEDNGSSKTSQNLGVIDISGGQIKTTIMGRSSDEKERVDLEKRTEAILSDLFGKTIKTTDSTPIWQPRQGSLLQDAAIKAYSDVYGGKKPIVKVEHGGLETAVFVQKKPELDLVSIGPTIEAPHSVRERVKIDTIEPSYNWLERLIQILSNK